jgi:recombination protein RecA
MAWALSSFLIPHVKRGLSRNGEKMAKKKKMDDLQEMIIAAIRKQFGNDSAGVLGEGGQSDVVEVLSTGIDVIDQYVLGCKGLPVGRIVELYSEEAGGKTSFTWSCIRGALEQNAIVFLCETENALNLERASVFGVDLKRVILLEPDHMEDAVAKMAFTLERLPGNVSTLGVWDSVASCATKKEVEEGLQGKDIWDDRAKILSKACRVLSKLAAEKKCSLLFVNQTRQKIGVMFGNPSTTPGGKALKFAASIRLQLFPGAGIKNQHDEKTGKIVTFLATKNRLASPYRKAKVRLNFATGWDNDWSTLERAKLLGLVKPADVRGLSGAALKPFVEEAKVKLDACGWCRAEIEVASDTEEIPLAEVTE